MADRSIIDEPVLSGLPDTDRRIFSYLDDEELLEAIQINRYTIRTVDKLFWSMKAAQVLDGPLVSQNPKNLYIKLRKLEDDQKRLFWALGSKELTNDEVYSIVERLIMRGVDLESKDRRNNSPMELAIYKGNSRIVKLFIDAGVNLQESFLWTVVFTGCSDVMKTLLCTSINTPENIRKTLVYTFLYSKQEYQAQMVELLLVYMTDAVPNQGLDDLHHNNRSLLTLAAEKASFEAFRLLVDAYKRIGELKNNIEDAILVAADAHNPERDKIISLLLELGGDTISQQCKDKALYHAVFGHNLELVKLLVVAGANLHQTQNLFHRAIYIGNLSIINYLLPFYSEENIHANDDHALFLAIYRGHAKVVSLLLDIGFNIHSRNGECLVHAIKEGRREVINLLITRGANIHAQDDGPLAAATNRNMKDLVSRILASNPNAIYSEGGRQAVVNAVAAYNTEILHLLLSLDKTKSLANGKKGEALMFAAVRGYVDIVETLIETGVSLYCYGERALKAIIRGEHLTKAKQCEMIKLLLHHGVRDRNGDAFRLAKRSKHDDIVEILLQYKKW